MLRPTDLSKCAEAAFQVVKRLKAAGTEEVIVLHVQDERVIKQRPPEQIVEFDRHETERSEVLCKALRLFSVQARPMLRYGIPFRELLKGAREADPNLIVFGSLDRSALAEMLAGGRF